MQGLKVLGLNHVGVAVRSIESSRPIYEALGLRFEGAEDVPDQRVRVAFFGVGNTHVELLEPASPESPIARHVEARGEGLHHVAFDVSDLPAALQQARAAGFRLIDETPRRGARGLRIAFLHPKSTGGVLIELCQEV